MNNPIPSNAMFDTPTTAADLFDWCLLHKGSERAIAITAAQMALNLARHLVNEQAKETA